MNNAPVKTKNHAVLTLMISLACYILSLHYLGYVDGPYPKYILSNYPLIKNSVQKARHGTLKHLYIHKKLYKIYQYS